MTLEIPPGETVLDVEKQAVFQKQRWKVCCNLLNILGFEGQDHEILWRHLFESGRGEDRLDGPLVAVPHDDPKAVGPDGVEMWTHINESEVGSGTCEIRSHQPSHCAGSHDADLHFVPQFPSLTGFA